MNNFYFHLPTEVYFGKGQIKKLPEILSGLGKKALLVYGGGSIKRNGLYDIVINLLKENDIRDLYLMVLVYLTLIRVSQI